MARCFADSYLPGCDTRRRATRYSRRFYWPSIGTARKAHCVHTRSSAMTTAWTTAWERDGPKGGRIKLDYIGHFDARGMRLVYGRGDHFGRRSSFHMDVWFTRNGRLLARFWSHSNEVDWCSFEVIGFRHEPPGKKKANDLNEDWVPQCLRDEYDSWIISEI